MPCKSLILVVRYGFVVWEECTRTQNTCIDNNNDDISNPNHSKPEQGETSAVADSWRWGYRMTESSCVKTSDEGDIPWPSGKYCIFARQGYVVGGPGFIRFDNNYDNMNLKSGTLPMRVYGEDTTI